MKKITSKNLNKRIASYSALAVAIAGVSDVTGQIQYTDVDPDEVLEGTRFLLDLNGDGITDYEISNDGVFSGVTPGTTARVYTENSQSILGLNAGGNYNYPFALFEGESISPDDATWITDPNYQTLNWQGCAYTNSQWCDGQVDKYMGLRINVDGNQHYGWVRMDLPGDASSITIKDYAFNTVPGEGLLAGQVLSVEDNNFQGFIQYVDANHVLNLQSQSSVIEKVAIFNISGQSIIETNLNNLRGTINLSDLSRGVYLAMVTIEGQNKTFKLVR